MRSRTTKSLKLPVSLHWTPTGSGTFEMRLKLSTVRAKEARCIFGEQERTRKRKTRQLPLAFLYDPVRTHCFGLVRCHRVIYARHRSNLQVVRCCLDWVGEGSVIDAVKSRTPSTSGRCSVGEKGSASSRRGQWSLMVKNAKRQVLIRTEEELYNLMLFMI